MPAKNSIDTQINKNPQQNVKSVFVVQAYKVRAAVTANVNPAAVRTTLQSYKAITHEIIIDIANVRVNNRI